MATQNCRTCKVDKDLSAFETYGSNKHRKECKGCRAAQRAAKVKAAPKKDSADFELPSACVSCGKGPDEVQFKFRADTLAGGYRSKCNVCINQEGYSQAYRARELAKDPVAYRARNAATHLAWAHRNPENVQRQQELDRTDPVRKFKRLISYARDKQIDVVMEDAEALEAKLSASCHYCGLAPKPGDVLNGLDRVDTSGVYSDANTVAACPVCNAMKAAYELDDWLYGVRRIYVFLDLQNAALLARSIPRSFGGHGELRAASKKLKLVKLNKEQALMLRCQACYLCGRAPALGIDRVDAGGDYTIENSRPCCSVCNYMKKDWDYDTFVAHISRIYVYTRMWVLKDQDTLEFRLMNGKVLQPVAVMEHDTPLLVFPSESSAATITGFDQGNISRAVHNNTLYRGMMWSAVDTALYRNQCIRDPIVCANIIKRMQQRA